MAAEKKGKAEKPAEAKPAKKEVISGTVTLNIHQTKPGCMVNSEAGVLKAPAGSWLCEFGPGEYGVLSEAAAKALLAKE